MLQLTRLTGAYAVIVALLAVSALAGSSIVAAGPSDQATACNVINILRDQMRGIPGVRGEREDRASALAAAPSPILSHCRTNAEQPIEIAQTPGSAKTRSEFNAGDESLTRTRGILK